MQSEYSTRSRTTAGKKTGGANAATEADGTLEDFEYEYSSGVDEKSGHEDAYEEDNCNDYSRKCSATTPKAAGRTVSERTQRRRDINRENARKSRMRKREMQRRLEVENERLKNENTRLTQALVSILQCMSKQQLQQTGAPIATDVTEANIHQWIQEGGIPAFQEVDDRNLDKPSNTSTDSKPRVASQGGEENNWSHISLHASASGVPQSSSSKTSHSKRARANYSTKKESADRCQKQRRMTSARHYLPESEVGQPQEPQATEQESQDVEQRSGTVADQADIDGVFSGNEKEANEDGSLHDILSAIPPDSFPSLSLQDSMGAGEVGNVSSKVCDDANHDGLPFLPPA